MMPRPAPGVRSLGSGVVAICVLLCVVGCVADSPNPQVPIELKPIRSEADVVLPMDEYLATPREVAVLATARSEAVSECMAEAGFVGYPVESFAAQVKVPIYFNTFGVFTEERARRHGFTPPFVSDLQAQGLDFSERFADWNDDEVRAVLTGGQEPVSGDITEDTPVVPLQGCRGDAPHALYKEAGATLTDDVLPWNVRLREESISRATNDERLRRATERWSACMKSAGYDYAKPSDVSGPPPPDDERPEVVSAATVSLALQVVRCEQTSGWIDTFVALVVAYDKQLIEQNAERLQQADDERQRVLKLVASKGLGRIRQVGEP